MGLPHFTKTYGQRGVLSIRLEGWDDTVHTFAGAIQVGSGADAQVYPMEQGVGRDGLPALIAPADLPQGLHLLEVQVDGITAIYRHLLVNPGPIGTGSADWLANVPSDLGVVHIWQNAGPTGPAGRSAYEEAVAMGFVGSRQDFIASIGESRESIRAALLPLLNGGFEYTNAPGSAEAEESAGWGDYSYGCFYLELGPYGGDELQLYSLQVRAGKQSALAGVRFYVGIYEEDDSVALNRWKLKLISNNWSAAEAGEWYSWSFSRLEQVTLKGGARHLVVFARDAYILNESLGNNFTEYGLGDALLYYGGQYEPEYVVNGYAPLMAEALRGEKGEPGPRGEDGKSPYVEDGHVYYWDEATQGWQDGGAVKGEPGQDGTAPTPEEVASALLPALSVDFAFEGPTASYNAAVNYFVLGSAYLQGGLLLTQFGWRVRFDSLNGCCTDPVYLGVWELGEDGESWVRLGVSLDTQVQQLSSDLRWTFESGAIRLSGRPLRFCLLASREDDWRTDLVMAMRTATTADEETRAYAPGEYASVPKFFFKGRKGPETVNMGGGCDCEGSGGGESGGITRTFTLRSAPSNGEIGMSGTMGLESIICVIAARGVRVKAVRGCFATAGGGDVRMSILGTEAVNVAHSQDPARPAEWRFDGVPVKGNSFGLILTPADGSQEYICYSQADSNGEEMGAGAASNRNARVGGLEVDFEQEVFEYADVLNAYAAEVSELLRQYYLELLAGVRGADTWTAVLSHTRFYLIGAGSKMAEAFLDGEGGMGFVEYGTGAAANTVVARGCVKFSELCTRHTEDFQWIGEE